jgi:hypothetical protein
VLFPAADPLASKLGAVVNVRAPPEVIVNSPSSALIEPGIEYVTAPSRSVAVTVITVVVFSGVEAVAEEEKLPASLTFVIAMV